MELLQFAKGCVQRPDCLFTNKVKPAQISIDIVVLTFYIFKIMRIGREEAVAGRPEA
jgi:hypothetical protein